MFLCMGGILRGASLVNRVLVGNHLYIYIDGSWSVPVSTLVSLVIPNKYNHLTHSHTHSHTHTLGQICNPFLCPKYVPQIVADSWCLFTYTLWLGVTAVLTPSTLLAYNQLWLLLKTLRKPTCTGRFTRH